MKVKDLSVGYSVRGKDLIIAKDINFSLQPGELIGIVGANGVGKSTLLRTLAKIQPKLNGEIEINGKNILKYKPLELASELSLVLTEKIPSKNITVIELIALGRQPYTNWIGALNKNDIRKIKEAIALVNLQELENKKCYELSDGQLQKVMISRALAQDTSLIILDEPTTHLDIYHKAYILKILKKIAFETGKTILFSSHEIDLAIQLCDKMLVMSKNKTTFGDPCSLIEEGKFNELFPKDLIEFDTKTGSFRVNQ
ncbi:ABC-type cobalamin/Fe3+-siderophore transport system, ATPase component [Zhouia amylolytica AD3]|uniref:ABC-type cobalamin/Fe3+-siderophore transport system, ATPase component n=1 Tax=Zhouia amylolytica AD3 TaxID=1286632 RepID=W2UP50_9FLAO|nr:ABC transporter ATP-binding protein [Zhouia amylolytica]ETN95950.1 ABC-type cobalamin/Fe3+-siderophore transport system, ATPase component [Zhouia amylolytica AD3]